jgi:hypothetical protein
LKGKDDRNRNVRIGCRILRRLSTGEIATWGLLSSVRKVAFANGTDATPPEESITANSADSHDRQIVNANFLASKPRENEDTILINLAKRRLPASDIRSILSQSIKQDATPNINRTGYTANFTAEVLPASKTSWQCSPFWLCIRLIAILILVLSFHFGPTTSTHPSAISSTGTLRVSAHDHSKTIQGALIDRGANGGIAGNDVCVISVSDRVVDVTGIDNHQLTSIKIGTVGAIAQLQRGPVILIMHQ